MIILTHFNIIILYKSEICVRIIIINIKVFGVKDCNYFIENSLVKQIILIIPRYN